MGPQQLSDKALQHPHPESLHPGRDRQAGLKNRVHTIVQGEFHASDDPGLVIATTVGSCVAACLHDPLLGLGGMNHFLLPGGHDCGSRDNARRYGVHLMELLVNSLLGRGASRSRLQAKVFGGARITRGLTEAGPLNAAFVEDFLAHEGIPLVGGSLRGTQGRRVQFWPATGRARQMLCGLPAAPEPPAKPSLHHGEVELF